MTCALSEETVIPWQFLRSQKYEVSVVILSFVKCVMNIALAARIPGSLFSYKPALRYLVGTTCAV